MKRTAGALAIFIAALAAAPVGAQTPAKSNVVLIVTDDVGYGDIGSYGAADIEGLMETRTEWKVSLARG